MSLSIGKTFSHFIFWVCFKSNGKHNTRQLGRAMSVSPVQSWRMCRSGRRSAEGKEDAAKFCKAAHSADGGIPGRHSLIQVIQHAMTMIGTEDDGVFRRS